MMKKRLILTMILLFVLGCNTGNSAQKEAKKEHGGNKGKQCNGHVCRGVFLVRGVRF